MPEGNAIPSQLRSRVNEWRSRLIDLSKRNQLLNYRKNKSSTLEFSEEELDKIYGRLTGGSFSWKVFVPPILEVFDTDKITLSEEEGLNKFELLSGVKTIQNPTEDEIVSGETDPVILKKILTNLYRKSREEYQERGVHVLHLGMGMLKWSDPLSASKLDAFYSPLLLCPVTINRESGDKPFEISLVEEELILNPALQVKFRNDYEIELPEKIEEDSETPVADYLEAVRQWLPREEWSVNSVAVLGMFSFEKMGMYHDLERNLEHLAGNSAILGLAGILREGLECGDASELPLDDYQKPEQTYQILDADSSQQQCIQAVLQGKSLVLQGPPGTGKSQTIANIIAEFLARKKTVLFVSEKMAALEVVYKRLSERSLGHYCLELHSRKANKKEVLAELKEAAEQSPQSPVSPNESDYNQLQRLRRELNDYVVALHENRTELGRSAYDVMSEVSKYVNAPLLTLDVETERLTNDNFQKWRTDIMALSHVWNIVSEGDSFPWRGVTEAVYRTEVREKWLKLLRGLQHALNELRADANEYSQKTGLPLPVTIDDIKWLIQVAKLIDQGVVPVAIWLTTDGMADIVKEAERYGECSRRYWEEKSSIAKIVKPEYFDLGENFEDCFRIEWEIVQKLFPRLDANGESYIQFYQQLAVFVTELPRKLSECRQYLSGLTQVFETNWEATKAQEVFRLADIAGYCFKEIKPEKSWLEIQRYKAVVAHVAEVKPLYEEYNERRNDLLYRYEESIFTVNALQLLEKFNHWSYKGVAKFLNPSYYKAKKEIIRCTRAFRMPDDVINDLLSVRAVQNLEEKLGKLREKSKELLGGYFREEATRFDEVEDALESVDKLLRLNEGQIFSAKMASYLSTEATLSNSYQNIVIGLLRQRTSWENELQLLYECVVEENWIGNGLPFWQITFEELEVWCEERAHKLKSLAVLMDDLLERYEHVTKNVEELLKDLERLRNLRAIQKEIQKEEERLHFNFGHRFAGVDTQWDEVKEAIRWTLQLRLLLPGDKMSPRVISYLSNLERSPEDEATKMKNNIDSFSFYFDEQFLNQFETDRPLVNGESRMELVELKELSEFFMLMEERIDELDSWIEYVQIKKRLHGEGLKCFLDQLESSLPKAELVVDSFSRSFYQAQVNGLFDREPRLIEFRGRKHQQVIEEFRELDRKLIAQAPLPIIEVCNRNKPAGRSMVLANSAEINVLRTEADKKRRHMPIMKLFQKIPNLLLRLKPCLMMSPLSVSQYIHPDCFSFDLVIFDEASQIFTEDAVVAMYRGKQIVIAGDSKQMPPTNFFRTTENDCGEYDEDEEENVSSADFSSVLDECGPIFPMSMLRWHYRSKHESLIAFSNHQFYNSKLVTFPSAMQKCDHLGIQFEYVENGIYERGGKKINHIEACRVAEIVIRNFMQCPKKSIGVVAFSQAQMIAIQDVLELKRQQDPRLEPLFKENRLDGFFCKNLENVQGDERDIIIFSVGYGKDAQGKMSMNFGPLNKEGGERRLNVAVTRAREKIVLVSSIRSGDINLMGSKSAGVLNLYHYLRFAELGESALCLNGPEGMEDTDSPFEDDVIGVIRQFGYSAVPQVGCSGYRIDIGVVHPSEPGRFILGVECDGKTYHSAPTARDRDRLRQQVLEGLGWRIYRIWSPDWFQRREVEIERLKAALEEATGAPAIGKKDEGIKYDFDVSLQPLKENREGSPLLNGMAGYQVFTVGGVSQKCDFYQPEARGSHLNNVVKLAKQEGPIHIDIVAKRLADAWDLSRVGAKIRRTVELVCEEAQHSGMIQERNGFLWPIPAPQDIIVRVPVEGRPESQRKIEHIPEEEIYRAMQLVAEEAIGISKENLIQETARIFGFQRSVENVYSRLEECLELCLKQEKMIMTGENITLG